MNNVDHTEVLNQALDTLTTLKNRTQIDEWPDCIMELCENTIASLERATQSATVLNLIYPPLPNPNFPGITLGDVSCAQLEDRYTVDELLEYGATAVKGSGTLWADVALPPCLYPETVSDITGKTISAQYTADQLLMYYASIDSHQNWQAAKRSSVVSTRNR